MRSVTFLVLVLLVATVAVGPATAAEDEMPDNCKLAPTLEPGTHEFTIQERKDVDTFKIDFEDHDTAYAAVIPDPGETEMFVYAVPTYHDLVFDDPVPADIVTYAGNGQGVWSTYEVDEVSWKIRAESTGTACFLIYESVYQESEFPYDYEVRISFNEEPDWWAPLREQLAVDAREGTGVLTRNMPETPRRTTTPTATTTPAETTPSTTRRPTTARPTTTAAVPTTPPSSPSETAPTTASASDGSDGSSGADASDPASPTTDSNEGTATTTAVFGSGPGFGPVAAVLALAVLTAITLAAGRRRTGQS